MYNMLGFLESQYFEVIEVIETYKQTERPKKPDISEKDFAWYCGRRDQLERILGLLEGQTVEDVINATPKPIFDLKISCVIDV